MHGRATLRRVFLFLFCVMNSGCGGKADFGTGVTVPQSHQPVLTSADLEDSISAALRGAGFNVADAQRESQGPAKAESAVDSSGSASCSVDASAGGTGTSEFQVGRIVRYGGTEPAEVYVLFRVTYSGQVRHAATVDPPRAALRAYVSDSNRRSLGKIMLVDTDTDHPPGAWSGEQSPSFAVTFEPGTAYHFVVAGIVEVAGDSTDGMRVELAVDSLDIEVTRRTN